MNALVKKEIRLLLPSFLIGVALTFANGFLKEDQLRFNGFVAVVSIVSCSAIAVFMALNSFGAEISAGTFSMLLAQPVSRHRIWRTKTLLLAAALFIGGCLWCTILYLRFKVFNHPKGLGDFWDIFLGTWLFLLVIYSGALWTVLLFRQMAAAFWFTVLTPGAIGMLITGLWPEKYSDACEPAVIVVMVIYSLIGFWFARRLFLRAQDIAWTGGTIALPEMRRLVGFKVGSAIRRSWRPRAALLVKEFQLHQSQLVMAGVLALLHLGVILWRTLKSDLAQHPNLEFILSSFWLLWLVMPLLVGCAAVAEERKVGTLEAQLCLSPKRRTQFVIKLGVALFLSVLLGAVMPLLLEGNKILPGVIPHIDPDNVDASVLMPGSVFGQTMINLFFEILVRVSPWMPLITLAAISSSICGLAFYASTLARNTLQSLGPAVLGILIAWFLLFGAFHAEEIFNYPLWRGWLIYLIGVPVMALTLAALAFQNYKSVLVGWNVWRRNLLTLVTALAFVMTATTAIYHRAWERFMTFEPPHGATRLTQSNPVTFRSYFDTWTVRLPDGRAWTDRISMFVPNLFAMLTDGLKTTELFGGGRFLDGTNWTSVATCGFDTVGIQLDGSLWVTEQPKTFSAFMRLPRRVFDNVPELTKLLKFGNDSDWKSAMVYGRFAFLLKTDGTLWRLGTNGFDRKNYWQGLWVYEPQRLGTDSNWAEIFSFGYERYFRKNDGRVWSIHSDDSTDAKEFIKFDKDTIVYRAGYLDGHQWHGVARVSQGSGGLFGTVGVRDDGTFRALTKLARNWENRDLVSSWQDFQIDAATNWIAVAGNGDMVVTLKADGTLWKWNFPYDPRTNPNAASCVRLGTHSDWIAIDYAFGGIVSLAADGSLWFWQFEPKLYYNSSSSSEFEFRPLLCISRKPQKIAGIFDKAN